MKKAKKGMKLFHTRSSLPESVDSSYNKVRIKPDSRGVFLTVIHFILLLLYFETMDAQAARPRNHNVTVSNPCLPRWPEDYLRRLMWLLVSVSFDFTLRVKILNPCKTSIPLRSFSGKLLIFIRKSSFLCRQESHPEVWSISNPLCVSHWPCAPY